MTDCHADDRTSRVCRWQNSRTCRTAGGCIISVYDSPLNTLKTTSKKGMLRLPSSTNTVHLKNVADGKPTQRRHAHNRTYRKLIRSLEPTHFEQSLVTNLEGPKSISLDHIDAEFARLEDICNVAKTTGTEFAYRMKLRSWIGLSSTSTGRITSK